MLIHKAFFRARLSQQIAVWILLGILLIEAIIIIPSYFFREEELLTQLEEIGYLTISPIIRLKMSNDTPADIINRANYLTMDTVIIGGTIYQADGTLVGSFGNVPNLSLQDISLAPRRDSTSYEVYWAADDLHNHYQIIARLDASTVDQELWDYTGRMVGFILLITAFVTFVTMLAVGVKVIIPILHLRDDLLTFGRGDMKAKFYARSTKRSDELGDVLRAFSDMFDQIVNRTTELRRSEQRFRGVVGSVSAHIYMTRLIKAGQGNNRYISPNVETLTGYPQTNFVDDWRFWQSLIHPTDQAKAGQQRKRLKAGQHSEIEYRLQRADNQEIWVHDSAQVIKDEETDQWIVYGVVQDITERKQAEVALNQANKQLQQLNERLQADLILAQKIQKQLLPPPSPNWSTIDVVCYSTSARVVGGDFYSYHQVGNCFNVAVGDVSGKGMPAALLMAMSLALLQSVIGQALSPAKLLCRLDAMLLPYTKTTHQNCALVYLELFPPTSTVEGKLSVANAGCVTPIIKRANGLVEWVDVGGIPLGAGLSADFGYQEITLPVVKGDTIILMSDGIVEAVDSQGTMLGFDQVEQIVQHGANNSASAMLTDLKTAVSSYTNQAEQHDDMTVIVVRL